jgi:uncharacterized membrane protein
MSTLPYLLSLTLALAGTGADDLVSSTLDHPAVGIIPEIEVFAPRYVDGDNDSLNLVQGITVFGKREETIVQSYDTYRKSFLGLTTLLGEYAIYLIVALVSMTFCIVALTKLVKTHHIHLAHQHRHSQIHEYYLWRKALLEKKEQEKLTRKM